MLKDNNQEVFTKTSINWYPGHMKKTKDEIKKIMPVIDIVFEIIDARIPLSSKIKDIDDITRNKDKILIMSKADLCDINETNKWVKKYEEDGYKVVLANLNNPNDIKIKVMGDTKGNEMAYIIHLNEVPSTGNLYVVIGILGTITLGLTITVIVLSKKYRVLKDKSA